jgi:uncharacterized protein with beta-barrel porin domain
MRSPAGDEGGAAIVIERPNQSSERLLRKVGAFARITLLVLITLAVYTAGSYRMAFAQCVANCPPPPPPPPPAPPAASTGVVHLSSHAALFDIGNHFLRRLGDQATFGAAVWTPPNPDGGGADASEQPAVQRYRTWFELYGLTAHTGAKADFTGDRRKTFGGIAGVGATVATGVNLALSADQSQTRIKITGLPQSATLDMTQLGAQGAFEFGAFTLGLAAVHGIGHVESSRGDTGGTATASYGARAWALLGELSYLWQIGNSRVVPKLGMDWTRTETDAFTETGGALPVSATGQVSERTRAFIATEFGHTWLVDRTIYDATIYVRLIDNLRQDISAVQATTAIGPAASRSIQGVKESQFGLDGGATFSIKPSTMTRLYAMYDVRLRDGYDSHTGTLGFEARW